MIWISLWKFYNGTWSLCTLYSRGSWRELRLSKDIRFGLKNNKPLFPSGVSTLLPLNCIKSLIAFRHEGWHFGRKKGPNSGLNRFKVNLVCFGWKLFQWLDSENICGLMAEPQDACPNPGETGSPVIWAHDHQPGIERFGACSARHCPGFGEKVLQARAVSSSGGSCLILRI